MSDAQTESSVDAAMLRRALALGNVPTVLMRPQSRPLPVGQPQTSSGGYSRMICRTPHKHSPFNRLAQEKFRTPRHSSADAVPVMQALHPVGKGNRRLRYFIEPRALFGG